MWFRRHKPTLKSLSWDTTGWEAHEQSDFHRMWMTSAGDAVLFRFNSNPTKLQYDLSDLEMARRFFEQQALANGGVMLSVAFDKTQEIEFLRGVFKYRSPEPGSLAMYYVGILVFPFQDFSYQFNTESLERGTTGTREAAVILLRGDKPPVDEEPVVLKNMDEYFERVRQAPVKILPSDDEEYDQMFPNHPLSKVRALQAHIIQSLKPADWLRSAKKYQRA